MPWRLIFFIIIFALILFFIGFNLGENSRCDIEFGFATLHNIPIFFPIFVSFVLGILFSLPFAIRNRFGKKRDETTKDIKPAKDNFSGADGVTYNNNAETDEKIKQDAASARERFFAKRRGK